ncbi:hypothetical protein CVT24_006540 [Panaeolus cyanescens]|uniref:Protein kinase domain-containing protein n=1 Tax=Panaeolus cyanescens TaxID=181874 RepID=A0A409WC01_9AGAR|nr:hypothetical protein CVT24_006540 [Panaeolus cyanescens]
MILISTAYGNNILTVLARIRQHTPAAAKFLTVLLLASGVVQFLRRMSGLSRWDQFSQRLAWKLRPYFSRHPVSRDIVRWRIDSMDIDINNLEVVTPLMKENNTWWTFLTPFFAAHGYTLYVPIDDKPTGASHPHPIDGKPTTRQAHPFARRLYSTNKDTKLSLRPCVRGARDKHGRDVVIRIVSGPQRSRELEVLQRLTSPSALRDPRNITIPILDWLKFDGLVFIVMPRWDPAWIHDFGTVAECIHIAETFLAYLDFLHEHRIAHMDIHPGNMTINTVIPARCFHLTGLRDPAETRYAMIDFGTSFIYPPETHLDTVREVFPQYSWRYHGMNEEEGPFNPFSVDVSSLGYILDRRVRVIREVVPEIIPFVEWMRPFKLSDCPTAREAYLKFQELKSKLTAEQLSAPLSDISYSGDGEYQKKYTYKSRPTLPAHNWSP